MTLWHIPDAWRFEFADCYAGDEGGRGFVLDLWIMETRPLYAFPTLICFPMHLGTASPTVRVALWCLALGSVVPRRAEGAVEGGKMFDGGERVHDPKKKILSQQEPYIYLCNTNPAHVGRAEQGF